MSPTLKSILTVAAKNAINAVLTSSALMALMHGTFNFYSRDGWWNLGKLVLVTIATREWMVWGPKILNWTTTPSE